TERSYVPAPGEQDVYVGVLIALLFAAAGGSSPRCRGCRLPPGLPPDRPYERAAPCALACQGTTAALSQADAKVGRDQALTINPLHARRIYFVRRLQKASLHAPCDGEDLSCNVPREPA